MEEQWMEKKEKQKRVSNKKMDRMRLYGSLYWEFFKIGLFTIGGGMAMIPQLQQIFVKDKGWLTEEDMVDCIAVSQALPGVIAINSATYIGLRRKGVLGAVAATLGVVTPSFAIIVLAVSFLGFIGENSYIQGAFTGIKAAVCGLILVTVVRLGKQILKSAFQWILAILSLVAIGVFGVTVIWVIIAGAVLGILYHAVTLKRKSSGHSADREGVEK